MEVTWTEGQKQERRELREGDKQVDRRGASAGLPEERFIDMTEASPIRPAKEQAPEEEGGAEVGVETEGERLTLLAAAHEDVNLSHTGS